MQQQIGVQHREQTDHLKKICKKGPRDGKWARECVLQCEALGSELPATMEHRAYQDRILHGRSLFAVISTAGKQERSKWLNLKKAREWK